MQVQVCLASVLSAQTIQIQMPVLMTKPYKSSRSGHDIAQQRVKAI